MEKDSSAYRIKLVMDELNISQAELAKLASISASSLSDYLTGKYLPKQDKVFAIAKVLKVSPSWLMGHDVDKHETDPVEEDEIHTLAAHATQDLTQEEIEEIENYIKFFEVKEEVIW